MAGISSEGIALIKRWEGLRLESYQDIAGIWTIGYGHTGSEVGPGQVISEDEAENLLRKDVRRFEDGVNSLVKVPITQSMFDALVSFSYNVGTNALKGSTALKRLNKGDYTGAAEALTWWNKARNPQTGQLEVSNGLMRRRQAEAALFLRDLDQIQDTPDEETQGADIQENPPRRDNPITTRTTGGAVAAGTAGAAGAGAVIMDDEDGSGGDTPSDGGTQGGDTSTTDGSTGTDTGSTGTVDEDITDVDGDGWPDEMESPDEIDIPDDVPSDNSDSDSGSTDQGSVDSADDSTDASGDDAPDSAPDEGPDDGTTTGTTQPDSGGINDFDKKDYTDAFVVACGVLAVLAAIYVISARIDDWRKYRR